MVGVGGSVWGFRIVGGTVKEGKGDNVAVDRKDFGEEDKVEVAYYGEPKKSQDRLRI